MKDQALAQPLSRALLTQRITLGLFLLQWSVELLNPWADPASHLFIARVPVLGALIALFLLRSGDRGIMH